MNILTNFKGQKKKKNLQPPWEFWKHRWTKWSHICNCSWNFERPMNTLYPLQTPKAKWDILQCVKKILDFSQENTSKTVLSVPTDSEWQNSRLFQAFFPEQIKKKIHSKIKTKSCYQCHFKTSLTLWWLTHGDFQPVPNISVCLFSFFLTSTFCLILKKNLYLSQAQAGLAHFPVLFPDLEEALQNFKKLSWLSEHMGTLCIEPRHRVQWQCGTHTLLKLCHDLAQLGENLWVSAGKKKNMIKK